MPVRKEQSRYYRQGWKRAEHRWGAWKKKSQSNCRRYQQAQASDKRNEHVLHQACSIHGSMRFNSRPARRVTRQVQSSEQDQDAAHTEHDSFAKPARTVLFRKWRSSFWMSTSE